MNFLAEENHCSYGFFILNKRKILLLYNNNNNNKKKKERKRYFVSNMEQYSQTTSNLWSVLA